MIIYLDVLLIENFIVDFFLLLITANSVKSKLYTKNAILVSILGAFYTLTLLIPELNIFTKVPFKIAIVFIFIALTFKRKDIGFLFKASVIYVMYSMALSGICFYMGISNYGFSSNGYDISDFKYKYLILAIMVLYIVINRILIYIKDRSVVNQFTYSIEIFLEGYNKRIKAFLDTGNELREPATNLPVIIVERDTFNDIDISNLDKFYIPYKVVNGSKGNLVGFKPKGIKIYRNDKDFELKEAIVCLCDEKLSESKEYTALLSRGII